MTVDDSPDLAAGSGSQAMPDAAPPDPALAEALGALAARDPDLARAAAVAGPLPDRRRSPGFATLAKIVVQQQLSLASAAAIWGRLEAAARPVAPAAILALDDDALRRIGLSARKAEYCRALAAEIVEGRLDLAGLAALDDEAAVAALVRVKGIGRWTAEIYLLFALDRRDIWPAGDLALRVAIQRLKGLAARPDGPAMAALADPWRPWRGVAARLLWHYYRAIRGRAAGIG